MRIYFIYESSKGRKDLVYIIPGDKEYAMLCASQWHISSGFTYTVYYSETSGLIHLDDPAWRKEHFVARYE